MGGLILLSQGGHVHKSLVFAILGCCLGLATCGPAPEPRDPPTVMPNFVSSRSNVVLGDAKAPGQFEVMRRPADTTGHMWCAAGEYADRALQLRGNRRIYVVKPLGPSLRRHGAKSVVFTVVPKDKVLQAADTLPQDYNLSVARAGESQRMAAARQMCQFLPKKLIFGPRF